MIWLWTSVAVLVVLAAGCAIRAYVVDYSDAIIGMFSFLLIAAFLAAFAIVIPLAARHDETICARQATELERDTRFVKYGSFNWDCLTPSEDGWVSIDRVIKAEGSD